MPPITQTITALPVVPQPGETLFSTNMKAFHTAEKAMPAEVNAFASQANALRTEVNNAETAAALSAANAAASETAAVSAAAYEGDYVAGTTYHLGDSVSYNGDLYRSMQAGNVGHTPSSSPTWWFLLAPSQSILRWFSA